MMTLHDFLNACTPIYSYRGHRPKTVRIYDGDAEQPHGMIRNTAMRSVIIVPQGSAAAAAMEEWSNIPRQVPAPPPDGHTHGETPPAPDPH